MAGSVVDFEALVKKEGLANTISERFDEWNHLRQDWISEQRELQRYLFATSTADTTAEDAGWRNKTTLPKLTQIRDNLHANYMASLFPSEDWMRWEGHSKDDVTREKALVIEAYVKTKTSDSDFMNSISQLVFDYIDYGNCFAEVTYVEEFSTDPVTKENIPGYIGPKVIRTSPYDIVFNPTAASYFDSPKIVRTVTTIGELQLQMEENPDDTTWIREVLKEQKELRIAAGGISHRDFEKMEAFQIDGFGSLHHYFKSGMVEILEFTGDAYDPDENKLMKDVVITVIDRARVIRVQDNPSWLRKRTMFHSAWRKRPDNLYGMGPLHNLVGLQYRMDHLENLRADIFDMIATPPIKIIGDVGEFDWGPGEEVHIDSIEGGDVQFLSPPTEALNAEFQIDIIERRMEQFAGAPREALGIRTPGEKTAFEVQQLQNASTRIFQEKIEQFERDILEPVLNAFLEQGRRHLREDDIVRSIASDTGVVTFPTVTREDITARGILRPQGARHFAAQAQLIQTLSTLFNTGLAPMLLPHTSGIQLTKVLEDVLKLERHKLFKENIAIEEEIKRQKLMREGQAELDSQEGIGIDEVLAAGITAEEELPEGA